MRKRWCYIAEECGMPCFHWLFTKRQMSIRTAEVRPFYIFFSLLWWRHECSTSQSRRRLGSFRVKPGLLSELIRGRNNPKSAMKTAHH